MNKTAKKIGIRPIADKLLIQAVKPDEATKGGIVLPETARHNGGTTECGIVIAAGPGGMTKDGKLIPMTVKVGDRVYFQDRAGHTVEHDGQEYVLIREADVLCVEAP